MGLTGGTLASEIEDSNVRCVWDIRGAGAADGTFVEIKLPAAPTLKFN